MKTLITLNMACVVADKPTLQHVGRNRFRYLTEFREYAPDGTLLRWWTAIGLPFEYT